MSGNLGKKLACGHTCSSQCHAGKSGLQMFIMALDSLLEVPSFWIILIYTQYIYIYIHTYTHTHFHPFRKCLSKTSPPKRHQDLQKAGECKECSKPCGARQGFQTVGRFSVGWNVPVETQASSLQSHLSGADFPISRVVGRLAWEFCWNTKSIWRNLWKKTQSSIKWRCFQKEESNQAC